MKSADPHSSTPHSAFRAAPRAPHRVRAACQALLVASFLGLLVLPLAGLNRAGVDALIEQTERRRAAAFPQMEFRWHGPLYFPKKQSLRVFPREFEAWFNDHVGLRREFIRAYNLAKVCGLTAEAFGRPAVGQAAQSPVIVGRDGWLFWTGEFLLEDYRRTRPFTPEQLAAWRQTLVARRDWLARRGVKYVLFFAPNQQEIYSEHMPRAINRVGRQSRLDQLKAALEGTGIVLVDPREALLAAKAREQTYHKTDTHWNEFGAFVGYRELCRELSGWFPELRPKPLDDFQVQARDAPGLYVATLIDSLVPFRERLVTLVPKQPREAQAQSVAPPADSRAAHVTRAPHAELGAAIVLHDSFMHLLGPFLSEHWQHMHFVWHDDFPADYLQPIIDRQHPQVLIQEMVERKLMRVEPANPPGLGGAPLAEQPKYLR